MASNHKAIGKIQGAIKGATVVKSEIVQDGGRGAYDMLYDPSVRLHLSNGVILLIEDQYGGDSVEGETYRPYVTLEHDPRDPRQVELHGYALSERLWSLKPGPCGQLELWRDEAIAKVDA